ncbi:MAG TPA: metallopeptidase TldD-related protein [Thermoanaerobaculia bacterium]|nr:metallopeptidase TldD-related protein [Thermoanaerobaculia bacterium]
MKALARWSLTLVVATAVSTGSVFAASPARAGPSEKSAVLQALEEEMQRSVEGLKAKGDPAPYFISYYVTEREGVRVSVSRGALRHRSSERSRLLDVEVRAGDYAFDSTRRLRGERGFFPGRQSRPVRLPLEDDLTAMRQAIWLETDRRYKDAIESFIQVKTNAELKAKEEEASADFSKESPERFVGPALRLAVDAGAWEKRLKEVSRTFQAYPLIYDSDASLTAERVTRYFVSSEGTVVQETAVHARVFLYAQTKADDGMDLYRYEPFDVHELERLPDVRTLTAAAEKMAKDVLALRQAPTIEPYTGPAILSGRAAGVFFHEIFGHRIEGHRQKGDEEGQTFTKKVNEPVLPDFLSVYDDPTRERVGAIDLNGFYRYDDEGVRAGRVAVVEKGVLKTFLMSRTPVPGFDRSNGHGRKQAGLRAVGRQGNLIVETSSPVSDEKLRELLREECRKQGRPFGLFFADISGGFTFTGRGIPQSFAVRPIMVYRVYTDGRPDELVRGADLIGTPLVSFSKILAAGDTAAVFNGICGAESGWVPVAAVAPSILTAQIEIQKQDKSTDRPPILPPPPEARP